MTQFIQRTLERTHKGQNTFEFFDDYCLIAIKTTDPDYFHGEIIEIIAHKYRKNRLINFFHQLIKPTSTIPDFVEKLTGVSNSMVRESPSISSVLPLFLDFIGNDILIGSQASIAINFLYDASVNHLNKPLTNDYVDILRYSRYIMNNTENQKPNSFVNALRYQTQSALDDVVNTHIDYVKLKKLIKTHGITHPPLLNHLEVREEMHQESHFYMKNVVFTGKLDTYTRNAATQIIIKLGGRIQNSVSKSTDVLVVGNLKYHQDKFGRKSNKHLRAEQLIRQGHTMVIMTEETFLTLTNMK